MKAWTTAALAAVLLATTGAARCAGLEPFTASYSVKYSSFSIGSSRLALRREGSADGWIIESRANASGLARLVASGTLVQTSWLVIDESGARPLRFRFDDGMERKQEDVALDFDWAAGRVRGTAKGEPVDLAVVPGLQDPVSIQIATMLALQQGRQPGRLAMLEGRRIKTYDYVFQRKERITTAAGSFDTLVYTSSRPGSERVAWMWLAPELGYVAVQMEQYRQGKRLFAMYLQEYGTGD
jgi:hypothetical protein